jgi:hypothetical protein
VVQKNLGLYLCSSKYPSPLPRGGGIYYQTIPLGEKYESQEKERKKVRKRNK